MTDVIDDFGGHSGNATYVKVTHGLGYFKEMNIGFNVKNCVGSNLNSWISGFNLGVSYVHQGGSLSSFQNHVSYSVTGVVNYNIVFEGIGTFFSDNVHYGGIYQCN